MKKNLTELVAFMVEKNVAALKYNGIEILLREQAFVPAAEEVKLPKTKIVKEEIFERDQDADEETLFASV